MPRPFRRSHLRYILHLRLGELQKERSQGFHALRALMALGCGMIHPATLRKTSRDLVSEGQLTMEGRRLADEFTAVAALVRNFRKTFEGRIC